MSDTISIIAISDVHDDIVGLNRLKLVITDGNYDLLLIAGDLSNGIAEYVTKELEEFPIDVIFTRGNHDPVNMGNLNKIRELKYGDVVEYRGITIMGHPYMTYDPEAKASYDQDGPYEALEQSSLASKVDIVLSHAPPRGFYDWIGDTADHNFGSENLKRFIDEYQPILSINGHMHKHGGKGVMWGSTQLLNVATFSRFNPSFGSGNSWSHITIDKNTKEITFSFNIIREEDQSPIRQWDG